MNDPPENSPCLVQEMIQPHSQMLRWFHVEPPSVERPAFTAIILLHVDDDKRGMFRTNFAFQRLQVHGLHSSRSFVPHFPREDDPLARLFVSHDNAARNTHPCITSE